MPVPKQLESDEAPVSQAISPLFLAKPCQSDVQGHCADESIVLNLLARGKRGNLLVLVQVSHREVLSISLQVAQGICQTGMPVALKLAEVLCLTKQKI